MKKTEIFSTGLIKENPIFVLMLGMCPTLAITTSLNNGIGMGLATTLALLLVSVIVSSLRKFVPDEIRIPVYIIIIATVVSAIQMLVQAYSPELYASLGIYLPLITVNCIILGRVEAFSSKNEITDSILDSLGMGLGFTASITLVSFFRQLLGTGILSLSNPFDSSQVFFNVDIMSEYAINIFTLPAGAFLTLGVLAGLVTAISNARKNSSKEVAKEVK